MRVSEERGGSDKEVGEAVGAPGSQITNSDACFSWMFRERELLCWDTAKRGKEATTESSQGKLGVQ